ncbi:discoidin domain-containing protein [Paenibacillus sp. SYP-B3998]|uniref:Discoidin domain-containing protein n=1 Tax=Paenibacillus sp. SYP-B3998 TaxID=2678564 RepID=A0A6G3ZU93_9BACL|nr:discoidin domain-containing protein [Paenibacillus sp. SYP-B3998]NEW05786.1 discoidin domain-containing protein [Paenibacillus sp. SYP-B3998]
MKALLITNFISIGGVMSNTEVNLAFSKKVIGSSETMNATVNHAVDGDVNTFWQPLGMDRKEDNQVWMTIDLGDIVSFNKVVLHLASGFISEYHLLYAQDEEKWMNAYDWDSSKGCMSTIETALFPRVSGRYLKLEVVLFDPDRDFQLKEVEVYDILSIASGPLLDRIYFSDPSLGIFSQDDTIPLQVGSTARLILEGFLSDKSEADLTAADISFSSTNPSVVEIDENGVLLAKYPGVAQIKGVANLESVSQAASIFVDVYEPSEWTADTWLEHESIVMQIGQPSLLTLGSPYPVLHIVPNETTMAKVSLINGKTGECFAVLPEREIAAKEESVFVFPGHAVKLAFYEICIALVSKDTSIFYDAFFFTVVDPKTSREGQSTIVFLGETGKLEYVPDYKGNRVLDFSNSGYGGGGVKLPDIEPVVVIKPLAGDNTQLIQEGIDRISAMPRSAEGFRGAVILKKGIYEISGKLRISASGVVIRGDGAHVGGTLLYATGKIQRNLIEISGVAGPQLLVDTKTPITDLYVPSGARSFHVKDASNFQIGDMIKVMRYSNERWIHAIGMDTIRMRPVTGGTVPWPPFQLEFDRVITQIDGNHLTIDAPIASAIESRWGGGAIVKYEDSERIEQIGIENLRVDVAFDATLTDTRIDGNEGSFSYYADENHAINFIYADNVKHAWIRNIIGFHLQHALVQVGRNAKWMTIQDCVAYEFISVITGGRRYPYHLMGELTLVQRAYAEKARHAFAVDARVAGPNVFLDCESNIDYNTSEPHHRWSVGCLYDNVTGRIHIQDRGWLGSGHGWSGANYVAWNTKNELVSQQPPTAQNYAIGHVGTKGTSFLPNAYDPRPREDGYWESFGAHVHPRSLYIQQLEDRLGPEGVSNLQGIPIINRKEPGESELYFELRSE